MCVAKSSFCPPRDKMVSNIFSATPPNSVPIRAIQAVSIPGPLPLLFRLQISKEPLRYWTGLNPIQYPIQYRPVEFFCCNVELCCICFNLFHHCLNRLFDEHVVLYVTSHYLS